MQLAAIPLDKLHVSALNMRAGDPDPDVSDILPSVAARGIYQPLLVRPEGDGFGVVAGRRRLFAARAAMASGADIDDPPCAVMAPGDDAAALEASLLENTARLDADEVSRWETFAKLVKEGRSINDIAALFALPEIMVKRALALGALLPGLRKLYRAGEIDAPTVRQLTLATKTQQRAWMKLFKSKTERAPRGRALKAWLFGGDLSTEHALFDLSDYDGKIVADLFEERGVFADPDPFWALQNAAIAALKETRLTQGWTAVHVLDVGERFCSWDHVCVAKEDGGALYIEVRESGEVIEREGFLTRAEHRRLQRRENGETDQDRPERPELSKAAQTYIALHRHGAVRCAVIDHPDIALKLMIAYAIAGSSLWRTAPEPQRADKAETAQSVAASKAQAAFEAERRAVLALLGWSGEARSVTGNNGDGYRVVEVFARLLGLSTAEVRRVLAFVMAETLEAGSCIVEALGEHLTVDMAAYWTPDAAFYDLLRDKAAINAMLKEIGGKRVADGNVTATAKAQKQIIADFVTGKGREPKPDWLPRYMRFPFRAYTKAGGGQLCREAARVNGLLPARK